MEPEEIVKIRKRKHKAVLGLMAPAMAMAVDSVKIPRGSAPNWVKCYEKNWQTCKHKDSCSFSQKCQSRENEKTEEKQHEA